MTNTAELRETHIRDPDALERMQSELEQAHVIIEDLEQRLDGAIAVNRELDGRLRDETRRREEAERRVAELLATARPAVATTTATHASEAELREQLSITLEELQVMAEEVEVAQETIRRLDGGA